jgi:hypothetical protein
MPTLQMFVVNRRLGIVHDILNTKLYAVSTNSGRYYAVHYSWSYVC